MNTETKENELLNIAHELLVMKKWGAATKALSNLAVMKPALLNWSLQTAKFYGVPADLAQVVGDRIELVNSYVDPARNQGCL